MKKLMMFAVLSITLILGACSSETTEEGTDTEGSPSIGEALELQEVMDKAIEANQNLKSFSMEMDMNQTITSDQQPEPVNMDSSITADMVMEPLAMHQTMTMDMSAMAGMENSGEMPQEMTMEMYLTEDGFYMNNPMMGGWTKFPSDMYEEMMTMSTAQQDPSEQLKKLQQYVDHFSMKSDNTTYTLTISMKDEQLKKFMEEEMKNIMPEFEMTPEMMEEMKINNLEYTFVVNKETFYPEKFNMTMDMEVNAEGEKVNMTQKASGTYSNFNGVDEIVVPDEVKQNAQEMPAEMPQMELEQQ
ncbi:DUF6612 family protein [Bacillus taeanensis]|uniref:Lipoprotein n=1 Tax=Bacillus taeanensis TaxID=273032 RepID=A0A366XUL4_9BACI|nr:DUF6612 family protein [Bacillus taeanensis]RBW67833.1 hypothetical protein DS031_20010 [Bacillus taeanensis]